MIQKDNYMQIAEFVSFAHRWHVDLIEFQKMANWGTYTEQEFIENDILQAEKLENQIKTTIAQLSKETKDIEIIQNFM